MISTQNSLTKSFLTQTEMSSTIKVWYKQLIDSKSTKSKYLRYIAIAFGFITCGSGLRYLFWKIYNKIRGYPNGPLGIPIFGCITSFSSSPQQFLYNLGNTYGAIAYLPLFATNNLFIQDHKILTQLYKQKAILNRPHLLNRARPIEEFASINGQQWKLRRKYAATTVLNLTKSSFVLQRVTNCIDKYIEPIIEQRHIKQKQLFYPLDFMRYLGFNNVWSAIFDKIIPFDDPFITKYNKIVVEVMQNLGIIFLLDFTIGKTVKLPEWLMWKLHWSFEKKLDDAMIDWLNKSGFIIDIENDIIERNDAKDTEIKKNKVYIDYLMERHKENEITVGEIISDIQLIMSAAVDTTSNTAEMGFILLAKYPEIQEMVYNEIMTVMKNNKMDKFDFNIINELHIFRAFIHEILRIACVAITGIPHMTDKKYQITLDDGRIFNIPKNTYLHSNNWFMLKHIDWNNNDEIMKNVNNEIHLEYWIDSETKRFKMNDNFMLFGIGKRDCVGRALAMRALYATFALFITRYKFIAKDNDNKSMIIKQVDLVGVVLRLEPKIGVEIERR